eukprot:TRINITY_DN14887_c0_g2_i6.p1 TRINITY_DN14887_c0_g2~~TRINITY_DN14887_c0_g2_i6.p1  ORF type:complete len:408 (-),score=117.57 TRINITY_DN14887_c0_g2_i6:497-1720(-)
MRHHDPTSSFNAERPAISKLSSELNATLASFERERSKQLLEIESLKNELKELKDRNQRRVLSFQNAETKPYLNVQDSARAPYFSASDQLSAARQLEDRYRDPRSGREEFSGRRGGLGEGEGKLYDVKARGNVELSHSRSYKRPVDDYTSVESSYRNYEAREPLRSDRYNPDSLRRDAGSYSRGRIEYEGNRHEESDVKKYIGDYRESERSVRETETKQFIKEHEQLKTELDRMAESNLNERKEHDALINKYKNKVGKSKDTDSNEECKKLKMIVENLIESLKEEEKKREEIEEELRNTKKELTKREEDYLLKLQQMEDEVKTASRRQSPPSIDEGLVEKFLKELFGLLKENVDPSMPIADKLKYLQSLLGKMYEERRELEEQCIKLLEERSKLASEASAEPLASPNG